MQTAKKTFRYTVDKIQLERLEEFLKGYGLEKNESNVFAVNLEQTCWKHEWLED